MRIVFIMLISDKMSTVGILPFMSMLIKLPQGLACSKLTDGVFAGLSGALLIGSIKQSPAFSRQCFFENMNKKVFRLPN